MQPKLQVVGVTPFKKIYLLQLLSDADENANMNQDANQLILQRNVSDVRAAIYLPIGGFP